MSRLLDTFCPKYYIGSRKFPNIVVSLAPLPLYQEKAVPIYRGPQSKTLARGSDVVGNSEAFADLEIGDTAGLET